MDALVELMVVHPVATAVVAIAGLAILGLVFLLGYRFGIAKEANQLVEYLLQMQKDHEHRRIIRMQAVKPNNRTPRCPYSGCTSYPKKTQRDIAKYRRAREKQTRMRNK